MPKPPPVLKPREICGILESAGFTVPNHPGRDVSPVLLRQIIKDIGMTLDEFFGGR